MNGSILLYSKNRCSGGGRKGPTEPAAHMRRRTGCGSEVCEAYESKYGYIATANGRTAYLLGYLQMRTNVITDAAGFCVHGWFDFSDTGKNVWKEHTVIGGKGLSSGQGGGKVGNTRIVVGRDSAASVRDVTMSMNVSVP